MLQLHRQPTDFALGIAVEFRSSEVSWVTRAQDMPAGGLRDSSYHAAVHGIGRYLTAGDKRKIDRSFN
jgi:hypothetical protein